MGNCLKISTSDNISLLRPSENNDIPDFIEEEWVAPIPSTSVRRPVSNIKDDDQVKLTKRLGLIQQLPVGAYDGFLYKLRECVICMLDFCAEEPVRYLPCMHIYHVHCIDDWLIRSFTCPTCMEPVDAALLKSYETT